MVIFKPCLGGLRPRRSGAGAPKTKPQIVDLAPYTKDGSGSSRSWPEALYAAAVFGAASTPAPPLPLAPELHQTQAQQQRRALLAVGEGGYI